MRNYWIFSMEHPQAGWVQEPTTWLTRKDACDALKFLAVQRPDLKFLIGYQDDTDMLRIPDSFDDIPER